MRRANNTNARQNKKDQMQFLRDFDLLTAVNDQQKVLYQEADIVRAQQMMEGTYALDDNKQKFSLNCGIDDFQKFGPGIYLLFKFLKFSAIIFGVASLFAIINIGVMASGETELTNSQKNGFKNFILRTTLQNLKQKHFGIVAGFDMLIVIVISAGLIYWSEKQSAYVFECLKKIRLSSYYTVVLTKLPQNYTEMDMRTYLQSQYGPITELYTVRDFGEDILKFKDINNIVQQYKQEKALIDLDKNEIIKSNKLARLFLQFRSCHHKIKQQIKQAQNYKSCFAFVQFRQIEDRDRLLNKNSLIKCLQLSNDNIDKISEQVSTIHTYAGKELNFQPCQMQPNGIIWENLHLSLSQIIIKTTFILFLMCIVLFLSVLLISLLSSVQMSISHTIYQGMNKQQILSLNNEYALLSYCVKLSVGQFQDQSQVCGKFQTDYYKITYLVLLVPLSISLFKFLLTQLMKILVHFRRYKYQIRKIQSQAFILFIFYFLVTGFLQLIINVSFGTESSFFIFLTPFIKLILHEQFSPDQLVLTYDYTPHWYTLAAYSIILIGAISFNLSALGIIFYCFIRKKIYLHMAKKQKMQITMNKWLQGYTLQIQFVYASTLTIIFFTMLFAGSMPILYVLAFLSFFIQYWSYKYIFVRFCAKPLVFNHSISRKVRKAIFVAIIMHCLITPAFFKAPQIAGTVEQMGFFSRLMAMGYYFAIAILLVTYLLIRKPIGYIITRLRYSYLIKKQKQKQQFEKQKKSDNISQLGQPQLALRLQLNKKASLPADVASLNSKHAHQSYSMHQSKMLKQTLLTLYTINNRQRSRKTCLLNRQLFHLYEDSIKTTDQQAPQFRTLLQVIKLVRRDFQKHKQQYGSVRNPYQNSKKKLYQIYLHCKEGKLASFTMNDINYRFDKIDYICQKADGQNFTEQGLNNYDVPNSRNNVYTIESAIQEEHSSAYSEQSNIKNNNKMKKCNVQMPPESQNRLCDEQNSKG